MTYILTVCVSFSQFWGACYQLRKLEMPTLEACNAEREILTRFKDISWATCEPKKTEGKP